MKQIIVVLLVTLSIGGCANIEQKNIVDSGYQGLLIKPARSLQTNPVVDHNGRAIEFPGRDGRLNFVFFGYTSCPDVCPTTLSKIKMLIRKLGPMADDIDFYFVSIDPERDTAEQMKGYVKYFDSHITGITGSLRDIRNVEKAFGVTSRRFQGKTALTYTMEHSVFLYLVDGGGRLRLMYPATTPVDAIVSDVRMVGKQNG